MSYGYSFYNCFSPYQANVFPLYMQVPCENSLQTLYFANTVSSLVQIPNPQHFEPIVLSKTSNTQTTIQALPKTPKKAQSKQTKKISKDKDQNFGWRNQNKQRNVISSILKGYINFVLQERGMIKLIEQLSKKKILSNGVSNFYQFLSMRFPSRKSYVGIRYMQQTLTAKPSEDPMTFIMSITLRQYLKEVYPLEIIQSCKTKKKVRLALLKKARSIRAILFTE